MAGNQFGTSFTYITWGESHGPAIGVTIDGVPPGLALQESDLQKWLDQRKPGQNKFTTQRQEPDQVKILSGVFEGRTTGTPISLMIENMDQRSRDYGDIVEKFRPGHADYTYFSKYAVRDYRGGGRASARETAMRVAAGGIARLILLDAIGSDLKIRGAMIQLGDDKIERQNWDWDQISANPFWCPDATAVPRWEDKLSKIRKAGSSIGAVVEIVASGVPVGLGEPVYDRLDADLAKAMMSINGVKGVEIGEGFDAAALTGEENADEMYMKDGFPAFHSNHNGGVLGGISSGQDVVVRFAMKPTSSILTPRRTVTADGQDTEIITKGRHDPCVGIRAVPVGEAMMANILADHWLRHKAQCR